jgi:hypothetical protein
LAEVSAPGGGAFGARPTLGQAQFAEIGAAQDRFAQVCASQTGTVDVGPGQVGLM